MLTSKQRAGQLEKLFHQGKCLEYGRGEFIVRPGEEMPGLFYIQSGLIKSYNYTRFGEENLLSLRKEDEVIGLTTALTNKKLDVMYSALAPSVLWRLTYQEFNRYLENNLNASLAVTSLLAEMYRLHSEHILNLEYRSVRERLIAFLLATRWRFGRKVDGSIVIDAPLRHQDIASYINASRETTSRELNYLQRKKLIVFSQGLITLKQVDELEKYLKT